MQRSLERWIVYSSLTLFTMVAVGLAAREGRASETVSRIADTYVPAPAVATPGEGMESLNLYAPLTDSETDPLAEVMPSEESTAGETAISEAPILPESSEEEEEAITGAAAQMLVEESGDDQAGMASSEEFETAPSEDWVSYSTSGAGREDAPSTDTGTSTADSEGFDRFYANYFGIFYGPSINNFSSFQATPQGDLDRSRPLEVRNFATVGAMLTETVTLSGSAFWTWQPVLGQSFQMREPYLRIADSSFLGNEYFNLYSDARVHFGVSNFARDTDMLGGVQTVQVLTVPVGESRFTLGTFGSVRYNLYGDQGLGTDLELYLGPNVNYQISPNFAFQLLYEMRTSHVFGDKPFTFVSEYSSLEPGFLWDITPNLFVNPYLSIYTGSDVNLKSTSFGMTLAWTIL